MNPFETLRAIRDLRGSPAIHKALLYAMALRADSGTGECWPSYPRLALDAGVSLAVAKRTVRELESAGHITVIRTHAAGTRWSQVNRYIVHVRPDVGSQRADVVSMRDDLEHRGPRQTSPPRGNHLVSRSDDPVHLDDVVHEGHDVVSRRHPRVSQGDNADDLRHDGSVVARPGVVSPRYEDRVVATPDLPMELPRGRTFALTPSGPHTERGHASKGPPRHTPDLIAAKDAVVREFVACCEASKGLTPKKIHKRDHAAAFALAETYGATEACAILRRAFDDDFVRTKNTTIAFIESKAETYRGSVMKKAVGRRELQALIGDEPWLKEHQR